MQAAAGRWWDALDHVVALEHGLRTEPVSAEQQRRCLDDVARHGAVRALFAAERRRGRKIVRVPVLLRPGEELVERCVVYVGRPVDWPWGLAAEVLAHLEQFDVLVVVFTPKLASEYERPSGGGVGERQESMEIKRKRKQSRTSSGGKEIDLPFAVSTNIGDKPRMEDRYTLFVEVHPEKWLFAAIFDGHGGVEAAEIAKSSVIRRFRELKARSKQLPEALRMALAKSESEILITAQRHRWEAGTTALCAVISDLVLVVACIGDSRAVISRGGKAYDLTIDQRFSGQIGEQEKQRAEANGGVVDKFGYLGDAVNVSRALGDYSLQSSSKLTGLSADPEVTEAILSEQDEFLILACDGIFEVLTSQECVDFVMVSLRGSNGNVILAAQDLVIFALKRYATDNLTCVVVSLHAYRNSPGQYWRKKGETSTTEAGGKSNDIGADASAASAAAAATATPTPERSRPRFNFSGLKNLTQGGGGSG